MKNQFSRRRFIKKSALFTGAAVSLPLLPSFAADTNAAAAPAATNLLTLDASARPAAASAAGFKMGTATMTGGHTLTLDSRSLLRDGQPWIFISGEFHFARCPESEWRDELLKIKAGGVSMVATYIFWIHHEEIEGKWDWTGQRDLRKFLETCQDVGLNVLLRIGPWCHGEVRNGGFPDWLQKWATTKCLNCAGTIRVISVTSRSFTRKSRSGQKVFCGRTAARSSPFNWKMNTADPRNI